VCAVLGLVQAACGDASLPTLDTFESYGTGSELKGTTFGNWSAANTGHVQVAAAGGVTGNGAWVSNSTLSLLVDESGNYTSVWVQIYAKASVTQTDPTVENSSAAFYVNADGSLKALQGGTWHTVMSGVPTNGDYMAFVVRLEYGKGQWDLWVNTNGTLDGVLNIASQGMSMATGPSNELYEVVVDVGTETYVDQVALAKATSYPEPYAGKPYLAPLQLVSTSGEITYINGRQYGPGRDGLAEPLGHDLRGAMHVNDYVTVYNTNGMNKYTLNSGGELVPDPAYDSMELAYVDIDPNEFVTLYRATAAVTYTFREYDSLASIPTDTDVSGGSGTPTYGFNSLVNPGSSGASLPTIGNRFGALSTGDQLYYHDGNRYRIFWWNGSAWREGGSAGSYTIPASAGFYTENAADTTYNGTL